jgi:hypothetical protein
MRFASDRATATRQAFAAGRRFDDEAPAGFVADPDLALWNGGFEAIRIADGSGDRMRACRCASRRGPADAREAVEQAGVAATTVTIAGIVRCEQA